MWCLILTGMDSEEDLDRLERALEEVPELLGRCPPIPAPHAGAGPVPREALFARTERLSLEGLRRAGVRRPAGPLSPGVPVVAPGERITEKNWPICGEIGI